MKHNLLFSLLFIFSIQLFAQKPPMKWGNIPQEDLSMTEYTKDPDANAVVLGNYVNIEFAVDAEGYLRLEYQYHKRIKILKEAGFEEADINIRHHKDDEIVSLSAQVFNLSGDETVKTKVSRDQFFKDKVSEKRRAINFTFPKIEEGSIIEYKYTLQTYSYGFLRTWYFQEQIPTRWSEARLLIPQDLVYTSIKVGSIPYLIDESTPVAKGGSLFAGTSYRMVVEHAPALVKEKYITTMDDYYTKIEWQLKYSRWNNIEKEFFSTWEKLVEELWDNSNFGGQLKTNLRNKKLTDQVAATIAGAKTDKEKAERIYWLVAKSIQWNDWYSFISNENINKALSLSSGNSAAVNLGLIACLKEAGLKVEPVLVSTRKHGRVQPLYPIVNQFNHVIAYVELDGKPKFMDACNSNLPPDMININNLNEYGFRVDDKAGEWIEINPPRAIINSNLTISYEDDEFKGHVINSFIGYPAISSRKEYTDAGEEEYLKTCLGDELEYTVDEVQFKGQDEVGNRFVEDIHFTFDDMILSDKIYFNPLMLFSLSENPFKLKERNYPVDIAYPKMEMFSVNFEIPEGYKLLDSPESVVVKTPDGAASFQYVVEEKENKIHVLGKLNLKKAIYTKEEYFVLKELFDKVMEKKEEQIVFEKL